MAFNRDITENDINTHGVVSCPDRMTGTAAQNKQKFDELVREVVKTKFNGLLDDLEASTAAGNIGFASEGFEATNVKAAIEELVEVVDEFADKAEEEALKSEGYAVGTQNDVPAEPGEPYYIDNAKYYKEQAEYFAEQARGFVGHYYIRKGVTTLEDIDLAYRQGKKFVLYELINSGMLNQETIFYQHVRTYIHAGACDMFFLKESGGGYTFDLWASGVVGPPEYTAINSGIAKEDLASSVRTSLDKADTALQPGDITGKADKVENATNGNLASLNAIGNLVDSGVPKDLAKGVSNRNLLDNPWFTVNQRGQSSYSTNNAYTVDRWKLNNSGGNGSISVGSSGITFNSGSELYLLQQSFENVLFAEGTTFTVSAIIDGIVYSATVSTNSYTKSVLTPDVAINTSIGSGYLQIEMQANKSHIIKAVKLELGTISTLANDSAPDYATELLKCQRYYVDYTYDHSGALSDFGYDANVDNSTTIAIAVDLPVKMRTLPTVGISNTSLLLYNGVAVFAQTPTATVERMISNQLGVKISGFNGLTQYYSGKCFVRISISADL